MIQIDSREHQKVIDGIKKAFDEAGEKWFVSKLYVGDYMNYPKPVMRATELERMGFPRDYLLYAYRRKGQSYAWKATPKKNSPILFDTVAFEKWRLGTTGAGR